MARIAVATVLDSALRQAGIPIIGVSVGRPSDRTTWKVEFDASATAQQQQAAATLLETVDTSDATLLARQRERERVADLDAVAARTVARAVHVRLGRPDAMTMSAATWRQILESAWEAERG
jgi:hypothetical protein